MGKINLDVEMMLTMGWSIDSPNRVSRDKEYRRKLWFRHKDALVERWGDITKMHGWHEFEAPEDHFDMTKAPDVWGTASRGEGTLGEPSSPMQIAEVVPIMETEDDD